MDKDKQIEEMNTHITTWFRENFYEVGRLSNYLYNADYRKKSEVIDEFVERIKERLFTVPTVYNSHFGRMIDDIAKEMKGE